MNQPIRFTTSPDGHLEGCRAYVTQRTGGVSPPPFASLNLGTKVGDDPLHVRQNETRILEQLGVTAPARASLVHGIHTAVVTGPGVVPETDALVTNVPGLPLALTVADCYPVAVSFGSWRGLAHCGWRGVAGGIVEELLRVLRLHAEGPARVWIGPGIGVCCYEVGTEVAVVFPHSVRLVAAHGASGEVGAGAADVGGGVGVSAEGGGVHLDLAAEIARRLENAGVPRDGIVTSGICTACNTDVFFSHRAEGPTGRMSAYLV
ncbi:MAG: polyphenol oxidase family protein [Candidatus Eisenbacteria bacterium]